MGMYPSNMGGVETVSGSIADEATWSQILTSIWNNIDTSKVTVNAKIEIEINYSTTKHTFEYGLTQKSYTSNTITSLYFSRCGVNGNTATGIEAFEIGGNTRKLDTALNTDGTVTTQRTETNVFYSGWTNKKWTFYY